MKTPRAIRHKLIELAAELRNDAMHAKDMIRRASRETGIHVEWWAGVRDAKQADANKVTAILDAIDEYERTAT